MSEFSEEPRFTIEQIDLLQRLRRSGMTKQEILHALETLDRLDREHGDKFGRRTSSSSSSSSSYGVGGANSCTNNSASNTTTSFNSNNTASATTTSSVSCNGNNGTINSGEATTGDHSTATASSTTSKISTATQTQFASGGGLSPSPSNSYDTSSPPGPPPPNAILPSPVSLVALSQNGRDSLAATPNGKLSPPRYPVNSAAAARAFGFEASEEDLDVDDKVEELMRSVWVTFKHCVGSFSLTHICPTSLCCLQTACKINFICPLAKGFFQPVNRLPSVKQIYHPLVYLPSARCKFCAPAEVDNIFLVYSIC